jgi:hypothetical protein
MFKHSEDDIEDDGIFWIEATSTEDGGFDALFSRFIQSLEVHLSSDQKAVCEILRIPRTADLVGAVHHIESRINHLLRYSDPLIEA